MKAEIYQHGKLIDQTTKSSMKEITKWASQFENDSRLIVTNGEVKSFYTVKNNKTKYDFTSTYGGY